jgi:hypothetical protein
MPKNMHHFNDTTLSKPLDRLQNSILAQRNVKITSDLHDKSNNTAMLIGLSDDNFQLHNL